MDPTFIFGCKKGCKSRNYLIYTLCCGERGIGLALRAAHSLSTRRRALAELLQLVCRWHTRAVLYFFPRSSKLGWGKIKTAQRFALSCISAEREGHTPLYCIVLHYLHIQLDNNLLQVSHFAVFCNVFHKNGWIFGWIDIFFTIFNHHNC